MEKMEKYERPESEGVCLDFMIINEKVIYSIKKLTGNAEIWIVTQSVS